MKKLYYYAHTHWDREWYQPFESFRLQLVQVVKQVMNELENGSLSRFFLDGQAIIFEDILALAPELEPRLREAMVAGKLAAGPWYVLADQLLVSGESLVRNLQYGIAGVSRFGQPAMVGYCPDTFGHSADLPSILHGFGIDTAVVWRGVPPLADSGPLFWWSSPSDNRVLAYHLSRGYYQTSFQEILGTAGSGCFYAHSKAKRKDIVDDEAIPAAIMNRLVKALLPWIEMVKMGAAEAKEEAMAVARVEVESQTGMKAEARTEANIHSGSRYSGNPRRTGHSLSDLVLMPVGGDHSAPPRDLDKTISKLNSDLRANGEKIELNSTTLPDFLQNIISVLAADPALTARLPVMEGELRCNRAAPAYARSYLLPGVLSTRLYLKRANRLSEYKLHRLSEPIFSLLHALDFLSYPQDELAYAGKLLLKNHPHDSICGCSVDAVHRQMIARTERFNDLLDCLLMRAAASVSGTASEADGSADTSYISYLDPAFTPDSLAVFNTSASVVSAPVFMRWFAPKEEKRAWQNDNVQIVNRQQVDQLFSGWGAVPYYKDVELIEGWVWAESVPALGLRVCPWPLAAELGEQASMQPVSGTAKLSVGDRVDAGADLRLEAEVVSLSESGALNLATGAKELCTVEHTTASTADPADVPVVVTSVGTRIAADQTVVPVVAAHGSRRITNGLLEVSVTATGTVSVACFEKDRRPRVFNLLHNIRDVGDGGDSYNFDPLPQDKPLAAKIISVKPGQRGPLVASLIATYQIDLPAAAERHGQLKIKDDPESGKITVLKRSKNKIKHALTTEIILKRGLPIVFFETRWVNQACDHRLEVVFDTGKPVRETLSENHFSLLRRRHNFDYDDKLPVPVAHESRPDRYPCQRFFIANGQLFFNTGMPEYGVEGSSVSMTMLRAVSWLSKPRLWTRGGGAGPNIAVPEANCLGANVCSYGWAPLPAEGATATITSLPGAFDHGQAYSLAELFEGALWVTTARSPELWRKTGLQHNHKGYNSALSLVSFSNPAIRAVSLSVDQNGGNLILRLLNASEQPQNTVVTFATDRIAGAATCNLAQVVLNDLLADNQLRQINLVFSKLELKTLLLRLTLDNHIDEPIPAAEEQSTKQVRRTTSRKAKSAASQKRKGLSPTKSS